MCLLAVILYMLKKNLLSVKYSLLWLFFAAALILFAAVPYVVYVLRDILNIEIPVNLVFVLLFCFVLLVLLSVSVAISQLAERRNGWRKAMPCWKSGCASWKISWISTDRRPLGNRPKAGYTSDLLCCDFLHALPGFGK